MKNCSLQQTVVFNKCFDLWMYFFVFQLFLEPHEFKLPRSFNSYDTLVAEADAYCLPEFKSWLETDCRKNSASICFATQHSSNSNVLYIAGDTSVLYDVFMNEEERKSFLTNNTTLSQINSMKLRLQHDGFCCPNPTQNVCEIGNNEKKVILIETFSRPST